MANFLILVILLLCSAFFSGSETAIFSLSKIRVKRLQIEKARNARLLARLLDKPRRLIISILIGNMLVNILASATFSVSCLTLFGDRGLVISIGVMTFLILIFGEVTPKIIAIRNPESFSIRIAPYIYFFSRLVYPIRIMLQFVVDIFSRFFIRTLENQKISLSEEELKKAIELGRREGALNAKEEEMMKGVIRFGDRTVKDVCIGPKRVVAVDISTPLSVVRSIIEKKELSRLPVFEGTLNNIIGILYAKDLVIATYKGKVVLREILRKPFYVTEETKLDQLFKEFRTKRIHMALVKDSKGNFAGIVTLHDLLEEIIGKIQDVKG